MNPEIDEYGNERWYDLKGQLHRTDGPACEYINGIKLWYVNGKLHRTDGLAVEHPNGSGEYWLNGVNYGKQLWLNKVLFDNVKISLIKELI